MIFTIWNCYLSACANSLPGLEKGAKLIGATVEKIASSVSPAIPAIAEKIPVIVNPSQPIAQVKKGEEIAASLKNDNSALAPPSQHAAESQQNGLANLVLDAFKASGDHIRSHGGLSV